MSETIPTIETKQKEDNEIIEKDKDSSEIDNESDVNIQFISVITLPLVETKLNEENETILFTSHARIYRFDGTCEPPEWKERGTGELKILRHTINNSVRIVMRRDKTLKLCANHFITPQMNLKQCMGNDKAFMYTAVDFAIDNCKHLCLALKFRNLDNANMFKTKFEEGKEIVATECSLYRQVITSDNNVSENEEISTDVNKTNDENKLDDKFDKLTLKSDDESSTKKHNN